MRAGTTYRYGQPPIKAGELTQNITIQQPITIQNEYGANGIEWRDIISTRAKAEYSSGNRQNENNEIVHNYTITFTIRYYHKVNDDMRIIWNDKKYRILSINREIYKQSTTIITELIND